jgi:glycerol-3-phosphate dehydrogenase
MASYGFCNKSMKRDLGRLSTGEFDILIIGGGIYGLFLAWDAVLRGYTVALVEKGDFGSGTSAASLKIIHGGLRYLQSANFHLMQLMKQEQRIFMHIAPHIIHPLACIIPTYNTLTRGKLAFSIALGANNSADWIGNRNQRKDKALAYGQMLTKEEYQNLFPGIKPDRITGGALWSEAFIENPNRLVMSILHSAIAVGAQLANYVEVVGLLNKDNHIKGVVARDNLSGQEFHINTKMVINSAGAWVDDILNFSNCTKSPVPRFRRSIAFNIVTRRVIPSGQLVGFPSRPDTSGLNNHTGLGPTLFALNWGKYSLLGTKHIPDGELPISEQVLQDFLNEVNSGFPAAGLTLDDIVDVLWGYLPMEKPKSSSEEIKLVRDIQIIDHEKEDGILGLITVIGVRYTLARNIAQRAIDLVTNKLNRHVDPCQTRTKPVFGGDIPHIDKFLNDAYVNDAHGLDKTVIDPMVRAYGTEYLQVLNILREDQTFIEVLEGNQSVLKAEIVHAVREEMACTIGDVICRRTELAPIGPVDNNILTTCAEIMANELGWNHERTQKELHSFRNRTAIKLPF